MSRHVVLYGFGTPNVFVYHTTDTEAEAKALLQNLRGDFAANADRFSVHPYDDVVKGLDKSDQYVLVPSAKIPSPHAALMPKGPLVGRLLSRSHRKKETT